jgi:hypothetical protein
MVIPKRKLGQNWLTQLGKNPSFPEAMSTLIQGYLPSRYDQRKDSTGALIDPNTRAIYDRAFDAVMTQRHSQVPDMMGLTPAERAGFFDDWREAYDSIRRGPGGLFGLPSLRGRDYSPEPKRAVRVKRKPRHAGKRTGLFTRIRRLFKR